MINNPKTFYAVAEMMQIVAHQHGIVGPVEFTVSGSCAYDWCGVQDDYAEVTEDDEFYDNDSNCGDCGNCEDCWDEQMQECGLMPDGLCLKAGSEYCDWDCRMRDILEEI